MSQRTCKWVEAHVDDYLSGGLSSNEMERVELHITTCFDCTETIDTWSFLKGAVPTADMPELSPLVERRLLSGIEPKSLDLTPRKTWRPVVASIGAVAAVITMVIGYVIYSSSNTGNQPQGIEFASGEIAATDTIKAPTNSSRFEFAQVEVDAEVDAQLPQIETDPRGRNTIKVFPGTTLRYDKGAEVEVIAMNRKLARFKVNKGYAVAKIGPVEQGFRFIVETPGQEVVARGTVFSVEVNEVGQSRVRVSEGAVEVRENYKLEQARLVVSGEQLEPWAEQPDIAARQDLQVDMAAALGKPLSEIENLDTLIEQTAPTPQPQIATLNVQPAAAKQVYSPEHGTETEITSQLDSAGPDQMLKLAQQYRRSGAPQSAAAVYEQLLHTYPNSGEALIVMVAFGQLRLNVLNQPVAALRLFDKYLETAPGGGLKSAALSGRVRTLARLKNHHEVIAASSEFLSLFESGPAAAEMIRRRGEARAAIGACYEALRDFQVIIERWPTSAEAKRARQGQARCNETL